MRLNRLAIGTAVAFSLGAIAPACGSSDSGDSNTGGGGTTGGTGGGTNGGTGGGGGSSGASTGGNGGVGGGVGGSDASTGGVGNAAGASSEGGQNDAGPCGPLSGQDNPCDQCLNAHCCDEFKACADDSNCNEIISCAQAGTSIETCIQQSGSQGAVFTALSNCLSTSCGSECG